MGKQLDRLYHNYVSGVVDFILQNDNKEILIEECCDHYFKEVFTKADFQELINELQELCNQMKNPD